MRKYYRVIKDGFKKIDGNMHSRSIRHKIKNFKVGYTFWEDEVYEDNTLIPFYNKFTVDIPRKVCQEITKKEYYEEYFNLEDDPEGKDALMKYIKEKYPIGTKVRSIYGTEDIVKNYFWGNILKDCLFTTTVNRQLLLFTINRYEEAATIIAEKEKTTQHKFKDGEIVRIKKTGQGVHPSEEGKLTKIIRLANNYNNMPGYIIDTNLNSNSSSNTLNGIIGEASFEKFTEYRPIDFKYPYGKEFTKWVKKLKTKNFYSLEDLIDYIGNITPYEIYDYLQGKKSKEKSQWLLDNHIINLQEEVKKYNSTVKAEKTTEDIPEINPFSYKIGTLEFEDFLKAPEEELEEKYEWNSPKKDLIPYKKQKLEINL